MDRSQYISPFMERYGTVKMRSIFSDEYRHAIWRDLWYVLAKAQHKLGVDAIVCVRYSSAPVENGATEVMAYGTAVKYKNLETSEK